MEAQCIFRIILLGITGEKENPYPFLQKVMNSKTEGVLTCLFTVS